MSKQTFTTGQVLTAAQVNSLQSNDFNQTVSVKTAAYTLVAADKGTRIEFNTSGSVTVTVNTGLFDAGDTLVIQNRGAGAVTVTAGTATVNTSATLVLSQYDAGTLYFISASAAIFFNTDAGGGSPLTTKGDLYGFSTSDARIPIGANGTVLTADSAEATGLKWAAASSGALTLVKTQTMGTAVSSVAVTNVFSSTYDNYLVLITGGSTAAFAGVTLDMQLGSTTTGYYVAGFYNYANNGAFNGNSFNNSGNFGIVACGGNTLSGVIYLTNPNNAKRTGIHYTSMRMETTDSLGFRGLGFESSTTQHTDFTLLVSNGSTVTGGTIKVYGYEN